MASLDSLDAQITIPGGSALRDRYVSLAVFPAATPVPIAVLAGWWEAAYGWSATAIRHFLRALVDRSLISAYLADRDVVLLHDVFRTYLRHMVGDEWAALHRSLLGAYRPGRWSELSASNMYMWRHLTYHLAEAGLADELLDVLSDPTLVLRKVVRLGHQSLVADGFALDALSADPSRPDDWSRAQALAGAGYLLHGLTAEPDIARTLEVAQRRAGLPPLVARPGNPVRFDWVHEGPLGVDGHVGAVVGVATQGNQVASGGEDGTVRLWDLATRRPVCIHRGHVGWVFATTISPDGSTVASAGDDGVIRMWGTENGEAVAALAAHEGRIRSLSFSRVGQLLVSGGEDGRVHVWDAGRLALLRSMHAPGSPVWSVAFGCDDRVVAASGEDEFVRLYDAATGSLLAEEPGHRDWVRSVAFAGRAPRLVSGSGDRTMLVWSTSGCSLTQLRRTDALPAKVRAVAVSDSADLVVGATEDAELHAFTADGPAGVVKAPAGVDWIRSLALAEDGTVVAGCEDGAVRTWAVGDGGTQLDVLSPGVNTIWSAQFARGGELSVLGYGDGGIEVRDSATGDLRSRLAAQPGRVWSLAATHDEVAAACGDGTVLVWAIGEEAPRLRLNAELARTWSVAMAGELLAASTCDGRVRLWDVRAGKLLWERDATAGRVRSLSFDGSGELLAGCGGAGAARLWNTQAGGLVAGYPHDGWARAIAIDVAGTRLAIGSGTGHINLRELTTDQVGGHLRGHTGRILMLAFTHDSEHLISAAADGTVRVWSLRQQRELAQVRVDATLHCAAFDPATGRLLTGSVAG